MIRWWDTSHTSHLWVPFRAPMFGHTVCSLSLLTDPDGSHGCWVSQNSSDWWRGKRALPPRARLDADFLGEPDTMMNPHEMVILISPFKGCCQLLWFVHANPSMSAGLGAISFDGRQLGGLHQWYLRQDSSSTSGRWWSFRSSVGSGLWDVGFPAVHLGKLCGKPGKP